jgi:4-amino-4-deoxy-L-arabinose transferase-like glycosyltransferase
MTRRTTLYLIALLAATAGIRLIGVGRPLLGNFATKNVVYAMIARNWVNGRAPVWQPTLDCLAADGERGLYLLEVPISAYVTGAAWMVLGGSLDVWGRLTSIAFSTAAVALLFFLVHRWHGLTAAWAASVVLALSPVSVIYGQSFVMEPAVVFFSLAVLLCWENWLEQRRWPWLTAACLALTALLLSKCFMAVICLPLAAGVVRAVRGYGKQPFPRWRVGLVPVLSLLAVVAAALPTLLWLRHVADISAPGHPLSDRIYYSLRDSASVHAAPDLTLRSPAFYAQLFKDLGTVTLTPVGLALAGIGLFTRAARRHWVWLAAMALLVLGLPLKFHKMNYYFLVVVPPLCVMAGLGWAFLVERLKISPRVGAGVLLLGLAFSARYSLKPAFFTPAEDRFVLAAAQAVHDSTSPEEPVVTIHGSTMDLLYYCDRRGWALSARSPKLAQILAECRNHGARRLVVTGDASIAAATALGEKPLIRGGEGFRLYSLDGVEARASLAGHSP